MTDPVFSKSKLIKPGASNLRPIKDFVRPKLNSEFKEKPALTTKVNLRNKFGIIQEFLVIFIFHEKELIRNYLGIPIPI